MRERRERHAPLVGNIFAAADLLDRHDFDAKDSGTRMERRIMDQVAPIDYRTSRSICDAVGQRLQQLLRPDHSRLSGDLQELMDKLRERDRQRKLQG